MTIRTISYINLSLKQGGEIAMIDWWFECGLSSFQFQIIFMIMKWQSDWKTKLSSDSQQLSGDRFISVPINNDNAH